MFNSLQNMLHKENCVFYLYLVVQLLKGNRYFCLTSDNFWVDGPINSLVYSYRTKRICWLNSSTRDDLKCFFQHPIYALLTCKELRNIFRVLIKEDFIFFSRKTFDVERNKGEFKRRREVLKPIIKFAWIEVNKGCNLACKHCYANAMPDTKSSEMTIASLSKTLHELSSISIKYIQFIGGEPLLLGSKLKEMILLASSKGFWIEVFTNGTLINEDWVNFFKANNISVALSLHSYDSLTHDSFVGAGGAYSKTTRAIEMLNQAGVKVRVSGIVTKETPANPSCCKENNFISFGSLRMSGRATLDLLSYESFLRKCITKDHFLHCDSILPVHAHCFSSKLYVSSELDVFPCVMERHFTHGNIKNQPLTSILDKKILSFSKSDVESCQDCEFRDFCFDCRPDRLDSDSNIKSWHCLYNPKSGTWGDPQDHYNRLLASQSRSEVRHD